MKKNIAVILLFLMIACTAFSQEVRFGGRAWSRSYIAGSTIEENEDFDIDKVYTNAEWRANFYLDMRNETGTAGIHGSLETDWDNSLDRLITSITPVIWIMPTPEIYLAMGGGADGLPHGFSGTYYANWGLNATDMRSMDVITAGGVLKNNSSFWWYNGFAGTVLPASTGFFPGAGGGVSGMEYDLKPAIYLTVMPLKWFGAKTRDVLKINYFAPLRGIFARVGTPPPRTVKQAFWDHMALQLVYNFHDVGEIAVTLHNDTRVNDVPLEGREFLDPLKNIFAQWKMNLFGCAWEIGAHYTYSPPGWPRMPLKFGLGWGYGNFWGDDTLVLSSRLGVSIPMDDYTRNYPDTGWDLNTHSIASWIPPGKYPFVGHELRVGWDFVVNVKIAPGLRFYQPVGIGLIFDDEVLFGWHFSPYIVKKIIGGFDVSAGFRVFNGNGSPGWPPLAQGPTGGLNKNNVKEINWVITTCLGWSF